MKRYAPFAIAVVLSMIACNSDKPTQPKVEPLNLTGTWTGIGLTTSARTANFEITLVHTGTSITGTGKVQLSGSVVSTDFDISGYCFASGEFSLFFGTTLVSYDGTATSATLSGMISGGSMEKHSATFIKK